MANGSKLNPTLTKFIETQQIFFVATAAPDGRVNVSPKGLDALRVLSPHEIVWLNLSGSGNETAAHLRESSRMTLMFCAMTGDAMILRVYGNARTFHPGDDGWEDHAGRFAPMPGARQIFHLQIDMVQTSCGTGVPRYDFCEQRGVGELLPFYEDMGPDGVQAYWQRKNKVSIDGRPTGL